MVEKKFTKHLKLLFGNLFYFAGVLHYVAQHNLQIGDIVLVNISKIF